MPMAGHLDLRRRRSRTRGSFSKSTPRVTRNEGASSPRSLPGRRHPCHRAPTPPLPTSPTHDEQLSQDRCAAGEKRKIGMPASSLDAAVLLLLLQP
uniref:Uncharacterized protein n=1 Tax=Triticum urartu TaxID=4572 RepID=A0A8R7Q437_TRIUA